MQSALDLTDNIQVIHSALQQLIINPQTSGNEWVW